MPDAVFSPAAWCLLLALVLLASWPRLGRGWRRAGVAAWCLLVLGCMPLGANLLERGLEGLVPARDYCASTGQGPIVLLSGGANHPPGGATDYRALTGESWTRTRAATELWLADGTGTLWVAGGGPYPVRESVVLANLAREWGVPPAALRIEARSTTTRESARVLAGALSGRRARLVTSPPHRARALQAFGSAGIDACVHDTGTDVVPPAGLGYLLPQASAIGKSEDALHELVGLAWYHVLDWREGARQRSRPGRSDARGD